MSVEKIHQTKKIPLWLIGITKGATSLKVMELLKMTNNILTGKAFVLLCLQHGFKNYQEIADRFNDGKIDLIKRWGSGRNDPALITQIGLYAIAKNNGWL